MAKNKKKKNKKNSNYSQKPKQAVKSMSVKEKKALEKKRAKEAKLKEKEAARQRKLKQKEEARKKKEAEFKAKERQKAKEKAALEAEKIKAKENKEEKKDIEKSKTKEKVNSKKEERKPIKTVEENNTNKDKKTKEELKEQKKSVENNNKLSEEKEQKSAVQEKNEIKIVPQILFVSDDLSEEDEETATDSNASDVAQSTVNDAEFNEEIVPDGEALFNNKEAEIEGTAEIQESTEKETLEEQQEEPVTEEFEEDSATAHIQTEEVFGEIETAEENDVKEPSEESVDNRAEQEAEEIETSFNYTEEEKTDKQAEGEKLSSKQNDSKKDSSKKTPDKKNESVKKLAFGKKQKTAVAVIAIVLAAAVLFGIISNVFGYNVPESAYSGYAGINAEESALSNIKLNVADQKEKVKSMRAKGDTRDFGFYCRTNLIFDEWYESEEFVFGNPSSNECALIASILIPSLSEDECVYRSLAVLPGKELTFIDRLFSDIDYGTYDAKICVAAYETNAPWELIGVQYVDAVITVGVEYNMNTEKSD